MPLRGVHPPDIHTARGKFLDLDTTRGQQERWYLLRTELMEQRLTQLPAGLVLAGYELVGGANTKRWKTIWKQRAVVSALVLSDIVLALVVWGSAYLLQREWGYGALSGVALAMVGPSAVAWVGLRGLLGLYPGYGLDRAEGLRRATYAVFATLMLTAIFALALQLGQTLSRPFLVAGFAGLLFLAPFARCFEELVINKLGWWGKPVVILGCGEMNFRWTGAHIVRFLRQDCQLGFSPIAVFGYRLACSEGPQSAPPSEEALANAAEMSRERGVDTAIIAMPRTRREHVAKMSSRASLHFRRVLVIPNLEGVTNSAVVARDLAGICALEVHHNLLDPWARRVKRALDLFGAVVGGLLISPLLVAIAVLIKLDSPGKVFYGHQRLGIERQHFRCWKFRTMHRDADRVLDECMRNNPHLRAEWEQKQKLRDDPRVTRVGRFLRNTSLDELPQLWNVLLGEMSLTGPRPIVDAEVAKYGEVIELYQRVRPGMSGYWQVGGRSDTSYAERVKMDSYYVHNWSVWLDLVLLARTVRVVVLGRGAC